jgi:hypothetical protein
VALPTLDPNTSAKPVCSHNALKWSQRAAMILRLCTQMNAFNSFVAVTD